MVIMEDYDPVIREDLRIPGKVKFIVFLEHAKDITLADLATEITGSNGVLSYRGIEYHTESGVKKHFDDYENQWLAEVIAYRQ